MEEKIRPNILQLLRGRGRGYVGEHLLISNLQTPQWKEASAHIPLKGEVQSTTTGLIFFVPKEMLRQSYRNENETLKHK